MGPVCSPASSSAATAAVASRRTIRSREGLLPVRPTSLRGDRADVFRPQGRPVDELVAEQVLRALEPAALELSCRALEDVQRDRVRLDKHWRQRLERARYEAEDAERRYRSVDPENRLVGRSLESAGRRRCGPSGRSATITIDSSASSRRNCPREERARIAAPVFRPPALWHAPGTTHRDRKEIVRHLVDKVVVHVEHNNEYVGITIHWQGGFASGTKSSVPSGPTSSSATSTSSWTGSRRCATRATPRPRSPTPSTGRDSARRRGGADSSPTSSASSWCVAAWRDRRRTRSNSVRTNGGCRGWPKPSR